MIYIPENEIKAAGGQSDRKLSKEELQGLRHQLLNKLEIDEPPVKLNSKISYVEQQPWIQNQTIRDNIILSKPFDKQKYVETILACQLEPDLLIMNAGDRTEIGENGINLSGGQKARVSLARAIYQDADIVLMDDPVSALDAKVKAKIFEEVFTGLLKEKTRILVTNAVDFVHLADKIVIMEDGRIQEIGSFKELEKSEYMQQILDIHKQNREQSTEKQADIVKDQKSEIPQVMTEQWLDDKLKEFSGVNKGVDTVGQRG